MLFGLAAAHMFIAVAVQSDCLGSFAYDPALCVCVCVCVWVIGYVICNLKGQNSAAHL